MGANSPAITQLLIIAQYQVLTSAHTPDPDDDPAAQLEQADAPAGQMPQLIQDGTAYGKWMCSRLELAREVRKSKRVGYAAAAGAQYRRRKDHITVRGGGRGRREEERGSKMTIE